MHDLFGFLICHADAGTATHEEGNQVKSASSLRVPLSVVGERDIARGVTTGQERTEMSTVGVGPCDGAHSAHVLPQNTCIKRGKIAPVPFFGLCDHQDGQDEHN